MDARMFPGPLRSPDLDYGGDYAAVFAGIMDSFRDHDTASPEYVSGADANGAEQSSAPVSQESPAGKPADLDMTDLYMIKLYSRRLRELIMKLAPPAGETPASGKVSDSCAGTLGEPDTASVPPAAPGNSESSPVSEDPGVPGNSGYSPADSPVFRELSGFLTGILEMNREDREEETVFSGAFRNGAATAVLIFDRKTAALAGVAQVYPRLAKVLRWPLYVSCSSESVVYALYAEKCGIARFSEIVDFTASRNHAAEETLLEKADLAELPPLSSGDNDRSSYLGRFIMVPEITPAIRREFRRMSESAAAGSGNAAASGKGGFLSGITVLAVILMIILTALVYAGVIEWPAL